MDESPVINKTLPNTENQVILQAHVSDFITTNKHWNHLISKISYPFQLLQNSLSAFPH